MSDWPDRVNEFIEALRQNRKPGRGLASNGDELEELRIAALLAGSRDAESVPDPAFLADLQRSIGTPLPRRSLLSRGTLLRTGAAWVAGLAVGLTGGLLGSQKLVPPSQPLVTGAGTWFAIAPLRQIAVGSVTPFTAGAVVGFIVRDPDGLRAISRICTHMGCILQFSPDERGLKCPCHGAVFGLNGDLEPGYFNGSLPKLPTIDTRVVAGVVYVHGA